MVDEGVEIHSEEKKRKEGKEGRHDFVLSSFAVEGSPCPIHLRNKAGISCPKQTGYVVTAFFYWQP